MRKVKVALILGLMLVLVMAYSSQAQAGVDGYVWQSLEREEKAGVLVGASAGVTYFADMMGVDGFIFTIEEAYSASYIMDDLYENHYSLHMNLLDVIIQASEDGHF